MNFEASPPLRRDGTRIPARPLFLGLAGLLPFWALALGLIASPVLGFSQAELAAMLTGYGAVILSFLGGIRWGLATAATQSRTSGTYEVAVIPSLIGWGALLLPPGPALALLGLVTLSLGPLDRSLVAGGVAPAWYGRLRLLLSCGAGAALLLGAAVVLMRRG